MLSFEGKIIVFESLAISEIVYLFFLTNSQNTEHRKNWIKPKSFFYETSQVLKSSIQEFVWITEMIGWRMLMFSLK